MYALLQAFVRNRPEKFARCREVLHAYEVCFQLGFFVLRHRHHRPGHVRLRIMPEGDCELLWRHREEISNRMVVEPQPRRISQYELAHAVRAQRGKFSANHPTHGMTYDMYRLQMQGIEQVVVVDHHIKHVINMLNARARLKARMRRGIDRKVLRQLDQESIPATQATSAMEKEQGR